MARPVREYFYEVDLSGRLFHDGTELSEPRFLDFFFKRLRDNQLVYAAHLEQRLEPGELRVSAAGRLYHPATVGEYGLLHSRVALQLGEDIREEDGGYVLRRCEQDHRIRPL